MWSGCDQLTPILRYAAFWDARGKTGYGPRYIEEFQLIFVQDGSGAAFIGDQHFPIQSGDLLFYGPNVRHTVRTDPNHLLHLVGLVFLFRQQDEKKLPTGKHTSLLPIRFPRGIPQCPLKPYPPAHCTPRGSHVRQLCESLVLSFLSAPRQRLMEKRGLLLMLFEAWQLALTENQNAHRPKLSGTHRAAVEQAMHAALHDLADPFDTAPFAARAGVNDAYFKRLFKRHTGQSVNQFLNHHRLLEARRILVEGRLPVADVAQVVGFEDPFYFTRRFTRAFGVPPSEFRAKHSATPTAQ